MLCSNVIEIFASHATVQDGTSRASVSVQQEGGSTPPSHSGTQQLCHHLMRPPGGASCQHPSPQEKEDLGGVHRRYVARPGGGTRQSLTLAGPFDRSVNITEREPSLVASADRERLGSHSPDSPSLLGVGEENTVWRTVSHLWHILQIHLRNKKKPTKNQTTISVSFHVKHNYVIL